jgi:ribosomal protein S27E
MDGEKYIVKCPDCGEVEGYMSSPIGEDEEAGLGDSEAQIDEEVFDTSSRPVAQVRCPQCGRWLSPYLARPA